jgi:hypothetical protein
MFIERSSVFWFSSALEGAGPGGHLVNYLPHDCPAQTLASNGAKVFEIVIMRRVPLKGNSGFMYHGKGVLGGGTVVSSESIGSIISHFVRKQLRCTHKLLQNLNSNIDKVTLSAYILQLDPV